MALDGGSVLAVTISQPSRNRIGLLIELCQHIEIGFVLKADRRDVVDQSHHEQRDAGKEKQPVDQVGCAKTTGNEQDVL